MRKVGLSVRLKQVSAKKESRLTLLKTYLDLKCEWPPDVNVKYWTCDSMSNQGILIQRIQHLTVL